MAHHKHRHIKREKTKKGSIWIRSLTEEEIKKMDEESVLQKEEPIPLSSESGVVCECPSIIGTGGWD